MISTIVDYWIKQFMRVKEKRNIIKHFQDKNDRKGLFFLNANMWICKQFNTFINISIVIIISC